MKYGTEQNKRIKKGYTHESKKKSVDLKRRAEKVCKINQ